MDKNKKIIIEEHLKNGYEIDPLKATQKPFYTNYLSSYIRILRNEGLNIAARREKGKNFNIYFLLENFSKVGA
jgi:hypothetical protein